MHGLPDQSLEEALDDLRQAIAQPAASLVVPADH
jgi:coproporphyrinogen III oxidase-like Fe-S oxidoreductase